MEADALEDDLDIAMWYPSFAVRGSFGYKDNVTLSETARDASPFWASSVEALAFRLPTDGWQFHFFGSAENTHYFAAETVDDEQVVTAFLQATKDLGRAWETGVGLNYLFQNQVFDFSTTYTGPESIGQVVGNYLSPRWSLKKGWGRWVAGIEMAAIRQWLDEPLDSYWQLAPKCSVGWNYAKNSELTLSYTWSDLDYDTREEATQDGQPISDSSLALRGHNLELTWTHAWDAEGRWQSTTRLGFEQNLDGGSGFYDYTAGRVAQQLRYRVGGWEITASGRATFYYFPVQATSPGSGENRERTVVSAGLRAERRLTKWLSVHAAYLYEQSFSNLEFDSYRANTVSGGFGVDF